MILFIDKKIVGLGLAIFCMVSFAWTQETIVIKHSRGGTTVPKNPQKVVIMDFSALETYHELGIPVAGVPNTVPAYLGEYNDEKYAKVGSIVKADFKALEELKPDLIITGGRQGKQYDSLAMVAPTIIFGSDADDFWNSFDYSVRTIATLHGKEKLAEEKLKVLHKKADLVKAKAQIDPKKAVVAMHMNGRFNPSGPNSRFGFAHDVLGLKPAYVSVNGRTAPREGERPQVPKLTEINPDYLFIFDRNTGIQGVMPEKNDIFTEDVKATAAYKNGKVFIVPGWIWYLSGNGLISVDQKITDIGKKLYGITF
ncbi:ABC transporter substrate-binding protein [Sphingobacterium sp. DN00404]|uniref:ABC transporter substrate-binding protein n=1 Tax=Sphingobacterium micropteri TaxID=2763501 RepID=A0ABR7YTI5_9SPHI|nr:ABC transporter substrate-binding protein [Sphingobacterium micropteri]MBD1434592.1 ABC transporter substrate-binding protein [Sphingobacterium micropteri]